jgi:transposase
MPQTSSCVQRFIGFDIAKDTITLHDTLTCRIETIRNARKAIEAFIAPLQGLVTLAVCEATGGYETLLLEVLHERGIPAHRADAVKVKAFIRSFGTHGKTDAIDAKGLAFYAQERCARLSPWRPADKERLALKTFVERRSSLVAMRTAERNRIQAPGAEAIKTSLLAVLDVLDRQIEALDGEIKAIIKASTVLKAACAVLQGQKGVGAVTAATLLALMPELGSLTRRQAASLAGLAPHPKDSGSLKAYRRTRGGRPDVRRTLFMAAMAAVRHDDKLREFHQKLIAKGKKPLSALSAVMRRIIVILNAKIRDSGKVQQS